MGKGGDHTDSFVLARHRDRRAQGVPTLSVLVGDVEIACWCWTGYQRASATPFVCSGAASGDAALRDWLSSGALHAALLRELISHGAQQERVTSEAFDARLRSWADGQRERAFEQLSARLGWSPALIAAVASPGAGAIASWAGDNLARSLAELESVSHTALPGLFVQPPRAASTGELRLLLSTALRIAEAAPRLEIACALTEAQLVRWRQEADLRELQLVGEGLIRVEPSPRDPAREAGERRRSKSSQRRAALGARDVPSAAIPCLEYDAGELARSRAEQALFEHLEARPRTRGLFALNGSIPEMFGARPLEVDLLSEPLRVALEIDGYHHFRDATAYRRDRDKDIRLQRLGYTVVRVLASDVDAELEYVTDTIDRVVEHEQRRRTQ